VTSGRDVFVSNINALTVVHASAELAALSVAMLTGEEVTMQQLMRMFTHRLIFTVCMQKSMGGGIDINAKAIAIKATDNQINMIKQQAQLLPGAAQPVNQVADNINPVLKGGMITVFVHIISSISVLCDYGLMLCGGNRCFYPE